jgi:hypothetical protein
MIAGRKQNGQRGKRDKVTKSAASPGFVRGFLLHEQ